MKELNTLANKKYELNLSGQNPTLDSTNGIHVGDTIIDIGADPNNVEWRCYANTAGNAYWLPFSAALKSTVGTGLIKGGEISVNVASGSKTFDISAGSGLIADQTTPENPIVKRVQWNTLANVTADFLTTDIRTNIFINNVGGVVQTVSPITFQNTRDYIVLGKLQHNNKSTINAVNNLPRVIYDQGVEADDIAMALGNINISGNIYSANGANLNINKNSGQSFRMGANYVNSKQIPNITTDIARTALSFQYRYRDSLGGFVTSSSTTTIDASHYDTNTGTPTLIPSSGQKSRWTIQRIYFFPGAGNTYITYGQAYYDTIAEARNAIVSESPIVDPLLSSEASLRCYLIVEKSTTSLNDTVNNIFTSTGKIGDIMSGSSAGGDVVGPTSSVDNSLARFDGTTGKLIKDGANIIATNDGYIGIGTISPLSQLHTVVTTNNTTNIGLISDVYGSGSGAGFICRRARGTSSIPSNVSSNDSLAYVSARGYGSTGFSSSGRASIEFDAAENWTDSAQGTFIALGTTQKGTTTKIVRMRIEDDGTITTGIINGKTNVASISTTYTVQSNDSILLCNAYSNPLTIDLPSASGLTGKSYTIKKIDSTANSVMVDANNSSTIDGEQLYYINSQNNSATMINDGSNWWIIAKT